jgi:uncharacterized protein involved in exopolysaccharide biosynthesis
VDTVAKSLGREAEIDLRVIVSRLWLGRWLIAASIFVFLAGFAAFAFLSTPIYRASTVFIAAGNNGSELGSGNSALGQLGGLTALTGLDVGEADSQTQEALAVLKSREFTEAFIRDENLMPELFPTRWDAAAGHWKGPKRKWPTRARAYDYFDKHVRTVTRDKLTGLITLDVEWRDPDKAAQWANTLVARVNSEMRARASERATASVGFLEEELAKTSAVETKQAITRLMEAQISQRMLAHVTPEYAFRVVDTALPPDRDDMVRPKKVLLLVMGPVLGGMLGAFVVLVANALKEWPRERS